MESREQQYEVLLPFMRDGRASGDRLLNIVASDEREPHRAWLVEHGLWSDEQVDLLTFAQTYLEGGRFSADRMVEKIDRMLRGARQTGFPGVRGFGEMQWALGHEPELLEYEARVNDVIAKYDDPLICIYDVRKFGGTVLMDVLATHPLVVLGNRLYENEYFVPPRRYLAQRARRRKRR